MRQICQPCHLPDGLSGISGYDPERFAGIRRDYTPADVERLSGSFRIRHTLAEMGARRLWHLLNTVPFVPTLGALTGNQALQQVKAGLQAIYLSGWQVAADANLAGEMYPDQSLYPVNSVPVVVKRINNALRRADQIARTEGKSDNTYWMAPIVADAEAGFGGALNAFELMKAMIEAGAAGVHFEDQLASEKKCGHLGGKVLVPISQHIRTLNAARLAADVEGVATLVLCRTDAHSAQLLTADMDERDRPFITGERTAEGFFRIRRGMGVDYPIARSLAYAPYADLLWWETSEPDLDEAERFAEAIHRQFPGKMLAYNCSPSFNWQKKLPPEKIANFQRAIGAMGYKFQFVTLAGFHSLNHAMFDLARGYRERGMAAYSELQQAEFAAEADGYTAIRHQREVGTGYFDAVAMAVSGGRSSTTAMAGSTEAAQFRDEFGSGAPRRARTGPATAARCWQPPAGHDGTCRGGGLRRGHSSRPWLGARSIAERITRGKPGGSPGRSNRPGHTRLFPVRLPGPVLDGSGFMEAAMASMVEWLEGLGLGQYAAAFVQADIDLGVVGDLNDADLEKLGVTLGHRKKLLRAIATLSAQTAAMPAGAPTSAKAPNASEAERRQLTVMFCDLVGSTALVDPARPRGSARDHRRYHRERRAIPSVGSTASSRNIWATACWFISAIRTRMRTMPSRRCAPASP